MRIKGKYFPNYWTYMEGPNGYSDRLRGGREEEVNRYEKGRRSMKVNKPVIFRWMSRKPENQVAWSANSKQVSTFLIYS